MDNIDDPWNFHTCKLCNYRTRFLGRILSHVRQHRTRAATHRFICNLHPPEEHKCEECHFQSRLEVLLTSHINTVHRAKETQHYLNSELRNCESCGFQTYSSLVLLGHNCDNGVGSGNNILQASQTGSGQRENCQSYKRKHSSNKKTCTKSAQISPNNIDSDDMSTADNMQPKLILHDSIKSKLSNVQDIQHPSNMMMTCIISLESILIDIDSDNMTKDNIKHDRILRSSKRSKLSNVPHIIQHQSNEKACTLCSQSGSNEVYSDDMTPDKKKHTRILRSSKRPKLSNIPHIIQHQSNEKVCGICSQSSSNDVYSDDRTPGKMKHTRILRNLRKHKHLNVRHIQHPTNKTTSTVYDPRPYQTLKEKDLRKNSLQAHNPSKNISWFKCEDCSNKYKNKSSLRRHVLIHHTHVDKEKVRRVDRKKVKCNYCSYKLNKDYLTEHLYRRHTPSEQINWYKCEYCSHKAKVKKDLELHALIKHTQFVEPEKLKLLKHCDKCTYKTLKNCELKVHVLRKHTPATCIT